MAKVKVLSKSRPRMQILRLANKKELLNGKISDMKTN
jgi:hypothetical protein